MNLPMPGDRLPDGCTVVASCDGTCGDEQFTLLVLTETPGSYYAVRNLERRGDQPAEIVWAIAYSNIIPAAASYGEQIGMTVADFTQELHDDPEGG